MMTTKNILLFCLLTLSFGLTAQRKVALQSNGQTTIFGGAQPFTDAINAASNGDTIYLTGGTFNTPLYISKAITIFGTGIREDSTTATGVSKITHFTIEPGADKFRIEGVEVTGSISFSNNYKIDSVVITRCKINSDINITGSTSTPSLGIVIKENVISGTINAQHTEGVVIQNNIARFISNVKYGHIHNNILNSTGSTSTRILTSITASLVENNRISNEYSASYIVNNCNNNTFNNNVFDYDPTDGYNTWSNNYFNVQSSDLFVNYSWPFNEAADYHVADPSTYVGTTGNQIGIYGGYDPAKEGLLPSNPHIQLKNIASQTDANGELQIQFKVGAQNE